MKFTNVCVCWEDRYYRGLDAACRRAAMAVRAERKITAELRLLEDTVKGHGGYQSHVENDWSIMRKTGIPRKSQGPIDHIIYVLDADVAHVFLEGEIDRAPQSGKTDSWHKAATEAFEEKLRQRANVDQARVHGLLLRWSKETLLLAAHDQAEPLRILNRDVDDARTRLYEACAPRPDRVRDQAFVDTFRSTKGCMGKIVESFRMGRLRKSDQRVDDLLKKFALTNIERLMARVPDLRRLAEKLAELLPREE